MFDYNLVCVFTSILRFTLLHKLSEITRTSGTNLSWFDKTIVNSPSGDHNTQVGEGTEQTVLVQRFVKHPGYNASTYFNDIALIELSRPVRFNDHVQPVCLPSEDEEPPVNSKCTITGISLRKHIFQN